MRVPRDVLKHLCVETAKAKRKCHRNKGHRIVTQDLCLVISDGPFGASKNYCIPCAMEILDAAALRVESLRNELRAS